MKSTMVRPVITERSLQDAARGWFTFNVPVSANKGQIAQKVHEVFTVDVLEVRSATMPGKTRRATRRMRTIAAKQWKKARVKLKEGQRIDAFSVAEQVAQG